ncbi:MAG: hypothetical protein GY799_29495 [Desulfobulbaceae bacterium]|nr:hypothetical protein [Desulfobulbaceae bacterium]
MSENPYADIVGDNIDDLSNGGRELPPIIPNSVLQLDGDISSYYLAWMDETVAQNCDALKRHIEVKRLMAGCETVKVYTTRGAKAGREDAAMVQQYQKGRQNLTEEQAEKKDRVDQLRQFMETYHNAHTIPCPQWEIEADDAMSIDQLQMHREGRLSKIMTKDKDLNMVDGTHIHYDTFEEWTNYGYGKIWMDDSGSQNKCVGQGTSFFWAQLLMGDRADDIPGLPKLAPEILNVVKPTKAIIAAQTTLCNAKATPRARKAAQAAITKRKAAAVGSALAHRLLAECKNDKESFNVVRNAYTAYYGVGNFEFETWRGDTVTLNSSLMLLEQAKLLWMLRSPDDNVVDFIKEVTK